MPSGVVAQHIHPALKAPLPAGGRDREGVLATHSDPEVRDVAEAIRLGESAVDRTERQDLSALSTLAAVQAEAGRFDDAVRTAREALALAPAQGDARTSYVEQQVARYQEGRTLSPISR